MTGQAGRVTDYGMLIDAEVRAFIERTNSFYPADTVDFPIGRQRSIYDGMCRAFHAGRPPDVSVEDGAIDAPGRSIPIRIYRRAAPDRAAILIYFHGGGFVLGGLESHDDIVAELCQRTGFEMVSVDYRLAPEHPHPASFEDALAGFEWAAATSDARILLCGDSAGGNLAAAVAGSVRGHKRAPAGQVLIYPALGGDPAWGSYLVHADAPMLAVRDLEYYAAIRSGGRDHSHDPTFLPLADGDFAVLPPSVVFTAECDPLSSDGEAYRDVLIAAGGKAAWFEEAGLVHGYLRARHVSQKAGRSFERIARAIVSLGKGAWPY